MTDPFVLRLLLKLGGCPQSPYGRMVLALDARIHDWMTLTTNSPGIVPLQLRDRSIALFRPEERVFTAMLEGWSSQMLARGLQNDTIRPRLSLVRRFQEYAGTYPWEWLPGDIEDFMSEMRSRDKPISVKTLRTYSNAIGMFCGFVANPSYGWTDYCQEQFGNFPAQIVFQWNSPRHVTDDDLPSSRRAFTKTELQTLFDYIDDLVDSEYRKGTKRWLPLYRNSVAFKVCYAYGLRRRELTMLEIEDFGPNPHVPDYGLYGAVTVRFAKGMAGTGPRRRTVLTVPEFAWVVPLLKDWISPSRRGAFVTSDQLSSLWPSERSGRMNLMSLGNAFNRIRRGAGLPEGMGLHCLRHSYVTHLIETGYDPTFVQVQVGHRYASTTGIYTSVSSDFKQKAIQQMITKRLAARGVENNG